MTTLNLRGDVVPPGEDPINHVVWLPAVGLDNNGWNPNRVHKPELRLLERSILRTGYVQPILVNVDGLIIDGFHRWRLAQDSRRVRERWGGKLPCAVLDVDRPTAMLMTIRMNRAKGVHSSVSMSRIVRELVADHGYTLDEIAQEIGATKLEVETLSQEDVFADRRINQWAYSRAWYPVEDGKRHTDAGDGVE